MLKKNLTLSRSKFVWHQTNALPFRKDEYVRRHGDWRTLSRLALYNRYTLKVFQSLGIPVIGTWAQTLAMDRHTPDIAHYPFDMLQRSTVQHVLLLICT